MQARSRNKLLAAGFDTELIAKVDDKHLTFSGLQNQNMQALLHAGFTTAEAELIIKKTKRAAIDESVIEKLLEDSGQVCAFCANGNNSQPYQIHHIEEYHVTQNNEESNLLLVCPTHHVRIHQEGITQEIQLSAKRKWLQTWRIARSYHAKGLSFPFKGFEALDYRFASPVTDIFSFSSPAPGLCRDLLSDATRQEASAILEKHHKVLLAGASGNGKSTLAKGIAGSDESFQVFNYVFPKDGSNSLQEMLQFLQLNVKPVILIVDDVNRYLSMAQVEILLKAASPRARVILIKTGLDKEDIAIEAHFVDVLLDVNWKMLQAGVVDTIRRHENEIVTYLTRHTDTFLDVGLGQLDQHLLSMVSQFKDAVQSVWEFVYILSNGQERCHDLFRRLRADEDLHLVVLFIGVRQIADAEKGVTVEEIEQQFMRHPVLNKQPPPTKKWLEEKMDLLINKHRVIKVSRGRFNTVHRQFAAHFIDHLLFVEEKDTEPYLLHYLRDPTKLEEILRLWSWLEDKAAGRAYLQKWRNTLVISDWQQMINQAAIVNLFILSQLAYKLSLLAPLESPIIKACFPLVKEKIIHLIIVSPEYTIYDCRYLFAALQRNCKGLVREILDGVGIDRMSHIMEGIKADEFGELRWYLSAVKADYPEWIEQIRTVFTVDFFERKADLVTKGEINNLATIILFEREFLPQFNLSRQQQYVKKMAALLKDCPLDKIKADSFDFSRVFSQSQYIESHVAILCSSLNVSVLAKEMESATPRHWANLLSISEFAIHSSSHSVIEQLLDAIDFRVLLQNMERYGPSNTYELRVCIFQLCHARPARQKEFANKLYSLMVSLVPLIKSGQSNEVLNAYTRLSYACAEKLAAHYQVSALPYIGDKEDRDDEETPERIAQYRAYFKSVEEAGDDIDLNNLP